MNETQITKQFKIRFTSGVHNGSRANSTRWLGTRGKLSGRTQRGDTVGPWQEVIKTRRLWFSSSTTENACLGWWFSNWGSLRPWSSAAWSQTLRGTRGKPQGHQDPPPPTQPERLFVKICFIYCSSAQDVWKRGPSVWDEWKHFDLNLRAVLLQEGPLGCSAAGLDIPSFLWYAVVKAMVVDGCVWIYINDLRTLKHHRACSELSKA